VEKKLFEKVGQYLIHISTFTIANTIGGIGFFFACVSVYGEGSRGKETLKHRQPWAFGYILRDFHFWYNKA